MNTDQTSFKLKEIQVTSHSNTVYKVRGLEFLMSFFYLKENGLESKSKRVNESKKVFNPEFLTLIDVFEELYKKSHLPNKHFLKNMTLHGQSMIALFDMDQKNVYVCTWRLHQELHLIHSYEKENRAHQIKELMEHTSLLAQTPVEYSPLDIDMIIQKYHLMSYREESFHTSERKSSKLYQQIFKRVNDYSKGLEERLSDYVLNLTANHATLRTTVLKFLAMLPCLDYDKSGLQVKKNLIEALTNLAQQEKELEIKQKHARFQDRHETPDKMLPLALKLALYVVLYTVQFFPARPLALLIRFMVRHAARRFIAGENIEEAFHALKDLEETNRMATFDQLGELVVSSEEADEYERKVIKMIHGLSHYYPKGERNGSGILKAHVSIKVSALGQFLKPYTSEYNYNIIAPRLIRIFKEAKNHQVFVNMDAEHFHMRDALFEVYKRVLLECKELEHWADTGIVLQAYLKDAASHLRDIINLAKQRGVKMPIRLVKGAYWDQETIEADAHNHEAYQFLNKVESDLNFKCMANEILKHHEDVILCLASHNIEDHAFSETLREELYPEAAAIEHQCLHMTYEALSIALAKEGLVVRNYIPIGNLLVGMAYLVRRVIENSSQVGVLTQMRSKILPKSHVPIEERLNSLREQGLWNYSLQITSLTSEFVNLSPLLFHDLEESKRVHLEMEKLKLKIHQFNEEENFVGNLFQGQLYTRLSDSPQMYFNKYPLTQQEQVDASIELLKKSFLEENGRLDQVFIERQEKLMKLSQLFMKRRYEIVAMIILESSKTIEEASADFDEAYDFIQFYLRAKLSFDKEFSHTRPRGVLAVISPWNFPLAIGVGMCTAALVSLNKVLFKPSEKSFEIAKLFVDLCYEAGLKKDDIQLVCSDGQMGDYMTSHKDIDGVVFTGSKKVGLGLIDKFRFSISSHNMSTKEESEKRLKLCITEMGGKNPIIITDTNEPDETVSGVIYSAFAHAGQKCSAASRILVDEKVLSSFLERLQKAIKDLKVGRASDFSTYVNPLISGIDREKLDHVIKEIEKFVDAGRYRKIFPIDETQSDHPYAIEPHVYCVTSQEAFIKESYVCQEIFAPIIFIIPYKDLDEAVEIANYIEYGLTAGIYSQSDHDIHFLSKRLEAGNIYVNRPNTGARVGIEPFGGFKLSGTGPKAGHVDYLKKFHYYQEQKSILLPKASSEFNSSAQGLLPKGRIIEASYEDMRSSGLSYAKRIQRVILVLDRLRDHYSHLTYHFDQDFTQILSQSKEVLASLHLTELERECTQIPGQLSYERFDHIMKKGLIVVDDKMDRRDLFLILNCLALGIATAIVASSDQAYERWTTLISQIYQAGFSPLNMSLFKRDEIPTFVDDVDFCYLSAHDLASEFKDLVAPVNQSDQIIKILAPSDFPEQYHFEQWVTYLTYHRSFAVNIMRHGASMN